MWCYASSMKEQDSGNVNSEYLRKDTFELLHLVWQSTNTTSSVMRRLAVKIQILSNFHKLHIIFKLKKLHDRVQEFKQFLLMMRQLYLTLYFSLTSFIPFLMVHFEKLTPRNASLTMNVNSFWILAPLLKKSKNLLSKTNCLFITLSH